MEYDLKAFTFGAGPHNTRDAGMCVMEAVAYLAGETHSDKPKCACPVITQLAIAINDLAGSQRYRQKLLADMPWRIVGTRNDYKIRRRFTLLAALARRAARKAGMLEHDNTQQAVEQWKIGQISYWPIECQCDVFRMACWSEGGKPHCRQWLRFATKVLDRMIRLTEPQEPACAPAKSVVEIS